MPRVTAICSHFANRGIAACLGALCLFALLSTEARAVLTIANCTTDPASCLASGVPGINDSLNDVATGGGLVDVPGILSLDKARISGVFSPDQSTAALGYEGFSPNPPTPTAPLALVGQGANLNIAIIEGSLVGLAVGTNVASGLLNGIGTKGALAVLYEMDQAVVGLDIVGFDGDRLPDPGASFVEAYAFARDGSLIGVAQLPGLAPNGSLLQPFTFSGSRAIAGLLLVTDDNSGVAVTNLRYAPTPSALSLMFFGLILLIRKLRPSPKA
jgi:hypothetical protein